MHNTENNPISMAVLLYPVSLAGSLFATTSDDPTLQLLGWHAAGAIAGGMLGLSVWGPTDNEGHVSLTVQQLIVKWIGSVLAGVVLAPSVMRYLSIDQNIASAMSASAGCSLLVVPTMHVLMPRLQKYVIKKIDAFIGEDTPKR